MKALASAQSCTQPMGDKKHGAQQPVISELTSHGHQTDSPRSHQIRLMHCAGLNMKLNYRQEFKGEVTMV